MKNGQLLPPKTTVELKANISPAPSAGVTIKKVQFYLNGSATGAADTTAPYSYSSWWNLPASGPSPPSPPTTSAAR